MAEEPENPATAAAEPVPELNPAQESFLRSRLESEQNFVAGLGAGLAAALAGGGAWALITVITGYQIGFVAIGIGFLVGYAVQSKGKGLTTSFRITGAALSLFGCLLGNLLAVVGLVAQNEGVPFGQILNQLTPGVISDLMAASFRGMDLLFYGIAVYEGYRRSARKVGPEEAQKILTGSGTT